MREFIQYCSGNFEVKDRARSSRPITKEATDQPKSPKPTSEPEFIANKIMLCVWWDSDWKRCFPS